MLLPTNVQKFFYLNIESFKQGEYWRFLSAHLIHYSWMHCISNVAGLVLLITIFKNSKLYIYWFLASVVIAIAVSSGLIIFSNRLMWYVGFSGVLTGLYAYASIKTYSENIKLSMVVLITLSIYVTIQILQGELISSILIPDLKASSYAHAYGLCAGTLFGIFDNFITNHKVKVSTDR
ncbi:MAG: rhombosortase [Gammaproteobacteria bacterium]|nr:rhombosortase [Gammaproteobacteria bacterium]